MAIEHAPVWRCEQCGHRWLIEDPLKPPKWCAKCRSRKWDASGAAQAGVQSPPPTFVPDAATEQIEAYKKRPRAYTAPTILPGASDIPLPPVDVNAGFSLMRRAPKGSMPPVDSDNRARLDKLNAAKYQKKK